MVVCIVQGNNIIVKAGTYIVPYIRWRVVVPRAGIEHESLAEPFDAIANGQLNLIGEVLCF